MQEFREMVRGWLGKSLLALLAIPFVFVGIESYFGGSSDPVVAEVDGNEINQSLLDRAVDNQRQQLLARMGPDAVLSASEQAVLRERVLDSLIQRQLLTDAAERAGYRVSDATVQQLIRDTPTFQEGGQFSPQRYMLALSQIGETPKTFPARARQEIVTTQRLSGWLMSSFVTTAELDQLAALDGQQRDVSYAVIPASRFQAQATVSEAEIKADYDKSGDRFRTPEQVSVQYLLLTRDQFAAQAKVEPADIQARYDERIKALSANEERRASHILIAVDDKTKDADAKARIEKLAKEVAEGADFAALAKANSSDPASAPNGGDLGYAAHGMYVPEFDSALFGLARPGDVSAVIKTQFGYHLIKLADIRRPDVPSLESLRPALEKEAREAKADELYSHAVEKLDAEVYESADLQEPARLNQIGVQTTPLFERTGGAGIAAERRVVDTAFSDDVVKDRKNSAAITLKDGSTLWLRLASHQPARKLPLAEVSDAIQARLKQQKALALALAEAEKVRDASKGKSLAEAAAAAGLSLQTQAGVGRRTVLASPELLTDVFRAPRPVDGKPVAVAVKLGDAAAVLQVTAVKPGEALAPEERSVTQGMLAQNRGQQELQDVLGFLKQEAKVKLHKSASAD